MGVISWRVLGQLRRHNNELTAGCLLIGAVVCGGAVACGGAIADEEALVSGGGGQTTTVAPSGGGQTTAPANGGATSTAAPACYGRTDIAVKNGCVNYDTGPFAEGKDCVFQAAILPNYKLNPSYLTIYFSASNGTKYVIPYIGTLADCASQATYGGWYASNIAGGSSEIGLCPCTCATARKHAVTALIDCAGIPQ